MLSIGDKSLYFVRQFNWSIGGSCILEAKYLYGSLILICIGCIDLIIIDASLRFLQFYGAGVEYYFLFRFPLTGVRLLL